MITNAAVYAIISPLLPFPTIWVQQTSPDNAPRPSKPYAALKVMSSAGSEASYYAPVDSSGGQQVIDTRDLTLEIQVFGDGANDALETLRQKLNWQTTQDAAIRAGCAIYHLGNVIDITALLDKASWESRAMLEIGIRSLQTSTDQVGLIETVHGTAIIGDRSYPFNAAVVETE